MAADLGINVISTGAFVPAARPWVAAMAEAMAAADCRMWFVQLAPCRAELERRVVCSSRRAHRKLVTVEALRTVLDEADYFAKINEDDLMIDNTSLDADQVAQAIASALQLNEPCFEGR